MSLSWNEIKDRALKFSREWADEDSERAEAQSFWNDFFQIFGITRKKVATFEHKVQTPGHQGRIDLLWKGKVLVEHKSRGKDMDDAMEQAKTYAQSLPEKDAPAYILLSDFEHFLLWDLEKNQRYTIKLSELHKKIRHFSFLLNYVTHTYKEEDPVNIAAAEKMGALHDELKDSGYDGHQLEVLLVRLLFCLFADDTGIFQHRQFQELILNRTSVDGADLGLWLTQLFQVLNTPKEKRQKTLDEQLAEFEYVNGKLFEEMLPLPAFNSSMRKALLAAADLDWSRISPAIFGSLFQSIMDKKARRNLGAHYTSEKNILKLIGPLFLDDLRAEFERIKDNPQKLKSFHIKLANLRFLDPACGCGNFLVIAYRELRELELGLLKAQFAKTDALFSGVAEHVNVDVDQFYGIEIEEFPAQIAQVAMWLMDHQMNLRVSEHFGEYFVRLPLKKSATIVHGNALHIDWATVCPPERLAYILGNPPFIGAKMMSDDQRADLVATAPKLKGNGLLDFVAAWYLKAADLTAGTGIRCAFVSTNSIAQGEQVGVLWGHMLAKGIKIHFAHRTFSWTSEAKGAAAVHCVIIGFGSFDVSGKRIWDYEHVKAEPASMAAKNISPYLVDADDAVLPNRNTPICDVPPIGIGNKPIDGGYLLLSPSERQELLSSCPAAAKFIRRWYGATEFLNGLERYCLWLGDASPDEIRKLPQVQQILESVRQFRMGKIPAKSGRESRAGESSLALAGTPARFHVENIPTKDYLLIPRHSSESRSILPMGFMKPESLSGDANLISSGVTLYHFGVMQSAMHMAWLRAVCGRIKSDYRYSAGIVYNNFPWPESPTDKQRDGIVAAAQAILDVRATFPSATLADLYDPTTMPLGLVKAHQTLDRAVDAAYGKTSFKSDAERVAFLFGLYQKYTSLIPAQKPAKKGKTAAS